QRVVINSRHQAMYWCRAACGGGSISGRSRATKTADAAGIDLRPDHGKKRADVSRPCVPRFAASPRSFSHRGLLAGSTVPFAHAPPPRPQDASEGARRILPAHGLRYQRFNYLGEWHSHPSFSVQTQSRGYRPMTDIVENGNSTITFAVLLIVRLRWRLWIDCSLTVLQRTKTHERWKSPEG